MSLVAKAHGIDGTLVEPDWPPLTLIEVRHLLDQYPDRFAPLRILSVSPRPFSAAVVVQTRSGKIFIKRHHRAVRDREGLMEEHRFMAYLRARGAPVPRVIEADSGLSALELNDWTYEVHETPPGTDLYEEAISWTPFRSVAHARSAGRLLAKLHLASEGYTAPPRKIQPLVASFSIFAADDPAAAMAKYLDDHPVLGRDAETRTHSARALELLAPFHGELRPFLPALTPLWTHNDLHGSNLFWSDATDQAEAVAIIDFGLADRTNAVHDLAHAIERSIVEWLVLVQHPSLPDDVPVHLDHLFALLDGYEQVRPLSPEQAAALAPMTALCHAEFALTEADYFLGVLHSREKTEIATGGYLVSHARWFHSVSGRRLLDALREWANRHARVIAR
ncbi:MAG TPA: phosphotransferase [Terracidiphilus sp.]|nr:phosphotransferase [Terracidiphilus sp.]